MSQVFDETEFEFDTTHLTTELFRECRQVLKMTCEEMAMALWVKSGRTIRRWEDGSRDIPGVAWVALSYMLDEEGHENLANKIGYFE